MARLGRRFPAHPRFKSTGLLQGVTVTGAANSGDQAGVSSVSVAAVWQGTNRLLAIDVPFMGAAGTVSSVTYGGAACTLVGAQNVIGGTGRIEQWRICQNDSGAPAAGSNMLVVAYSGLIADTSVQWTSYAGVDQATPTEGFAGSSGLNSGGAVDATVPVTPVVNGDWVHWALSTSQTSGVISANAARNTVIGAGGTGADSDNGYAINPAAAITGRWTGIAMFAAWAIAGYAIRPAPNNQSLTRTTTENPSTSDAVTRSLVMTRSVSEGPTTADGATRVFTGSRACTEAPTTADVATRALMLSRTAAEAPTTADVATRSLVLHRSATEAPTTADSITTFKALFRSCSENPTTSDSVVRSGTFVRAVTESPTTADSVARVGSFHRTTTENPTTADAGAASKLYIRTCTEAPTTADSPVSGKGYARTAAEAPTVADMLTRVFSGHRTAAENPTTTDAPTRLTALHRTVMEFPVTSDAVAAIGQLPILNGGTWTEPARSTTWTEPLRRTLWRA